MIASGQKVQDTPLWTDIKVKAKDHETGSIFRVYYLEATLRPPNAIQDAQELSHLNFMATSVLVLWPARQANLWYHPRSVCKL